MVSWLENASVGMAEEPRAFERTRGTPQCIRRCAGDGAVTQCGIGWRLLSAAALALVCGLAAAASNSSGTPPAAATPEAQPPFTADLGLYSDYIERGLSYSRERISLQGHFEYDSPLGLYGGAFFVHNSAILNKETVEFDPYVGYLKRIDDWTIDTGVFAWLYPHSRLDVTGNRYNTLEATFDVTYKIFGVKLWYDLKDFWGLDRDSAAINYYLEPNGSSKGSFYIDSHLNMPLPMDFLLKLHVGHQFIRNYGELDYTDWLLGFEKSLGHHLTLGGAYSGTNANQSFYLDPHGLNLSRGKWLAYLRWAFS
jgi:uncharacterized protein (TIGR02001 family)